MTAKNQTIPDEWKKQVFEEWRCEILYSKEKNEYYPSRLKLQRPCVKITSEQAATLNGEVVSGLNTFAIIYFYPGEYDSYPGQSHKTAPTVSFG